MQDIDFDELDKAVSSVLGTASKRTATVQPSPEVTPITPASDIHVSPTFPTISRTPEVLEPITVVETPVQPIVSPTVIRRSPGRFMDVVHPSSDMRGATAPSTLPVTEQVTPTLEKPELIVTPLQTAAELTPAVEQAEPLETPFLTDAKVEKRPLGAFSAETEPVFEAPVKPPVYKPTLEISEEALIGATETSDTDPKAIEVPEEAVITKIVESEPQASVPYTQPLSTSIQQQYVEQAASEPEQPSGAIFDTESYHQALLHPGKKKSGVSIVLWILGLIVLGVGLGAVLYFFVLQKL